MPMQANPTQRRLFSRTAVVLATVLLGSSIAWAQSPPAAETTFNAAVNNDWTNAANWTAGVVTPTALGASTDSGFVANNTTINVTSTNLSTATNYQSATPHFNTLTLGTNSTLNVTAPNGSQFGYYTASPYASPTPQAVAGTIWFNDGALAQLTSGSLNSNLNLAVVAGATGTFKPGGNGMIRGALTGSSTATLNVTFGGNYEWRATGTNLAGNLNLSSDGASSRVVTVSGFAGTNVFGTGTVNFNDNTRFVTINNTANKLSSSSTVKLVGDSGATNTIKFDIQDDNQTVGNLIVDSPGVALTGSRALLSTGTASTAASLTVSGTSTFQGTANTVEINNLMTTPTGNSLVTKNMTFGGTGTWAVQGDGRINLSGGVGGSTITTNVNASISNSLSGSSGFTKAGTGILTLTGDITNLTGDLTVSAGQLYLNGVTGLGSREITVSADAELRSTVAIEGISVSTGAALTIGSATSATDVLTLGSGGLALSDNAEINWQLGTTVSQYDQIVSTGTLDLTGLTNIVINGTSLGYAPQSGDSFTLFDGPVTGFNASIFDLTNMPALTGGLTWEIQQGSLNLVVVPEPGAALLGSLGLLALLRRRR